MTDPPEPPSEEDRQNRESSGEAVFKPSRWPGLIWAIPAAALAIVAWLGISALLRNGPSVEVDFPVTGGLKPGSTEVQYRGFTVGEVGGVTLAKSLDHMTVRIDLISSMSGHVGPGTRFWIAGHSLDFTNLESLKALISGPFIGMDPRPGKTIRHAKGLGTPPILKYDPQGETLRLVADRLYHVSAGSPVYFKGYKVGEVRGVTMEPDGKRFDIYAFIERARDNLLDGNTRFWDAGAVRVSTGGAGIGLRIQSVPALLIGAVAFETPGRPAGRPVADGATFTLYPNEDAARDAPGPGAVPYRAVFAGGPNGLKPGAPVQLEGASAGVVTAVSTQYDPSRGELRTVVDLVLEPERIPLAGAKWHSNPAPQMNAMLAKLIGRGLRARLASSVPVVGGKIVQLDFMPGQPPARLGPGHPPLIPFFGGGSGVAQILTQINAILAKVKALPLDQIGDEVHEATSRLAKLSTSPETKRTLERLDRSIANFQDLSRHADAQLPAILQAVKRSADEAQRALDQVQGMLSAEGPANAPPEATDVPHALYELTLAAQSLRELTDFLNSHPNALIIGRGD